MGKYYRIEGAESMDDICFKPSVEGIWGNMSPQTEIGHPSAYLGFKPSVEGIWGNIHHSLGGRGKRHARFKPSVEGIWGNINIVDETSRATGSRCFKPSVEGIWGNIATYTLVAGVSSSGFKPSVEGIWGNIAEMKKLFLLAIILFQALG